MKKAFTLIEIMMVVAIIALLSAIGIPALLHSHEGAKEQVKEVNIDTVNAAKDQWALLNNKPAGTTVNWDDIKYYIGGRIEYQTDLDVNGDTIILNNVGISAKYP
ncbi:type II secretion system protein [Tichowtungia aerotolerans]|uniref:Prepilin-type N-terminal cleavage/methylation domain-containing protein n=1 Tax=Tichowtungia aerotolerans TaxID=2697043 RepID=A0A6P1MAQ2_9BACT|nr:prepilin-type N-terminal cleavage/methylation domain-containing protein [Tichowtungia aerotolerans]QHI68205.1 prepilin-type N-terminal cleavage/methylation domain-containing protein [Tichowtungia aerotolerans]